MNIAELIEKLKEHDPSMRVGHYYCGCDYDGHYEEARDVEIVTETIYGEAEPEKFVVIG